MIEVETTIAPAYWASYLVNGDASGMEEDELAKCDKWLAHQTKEGWRVVSCEGESFIGRFQGMQTELVEYTLHRTTK